MPPISNFSSNAKLVTANPVYPYGRCIVARPPEGALHKVSHHAWWPSRRSALDIFLGYMESKALFSRTLSMLSCMSTPARCSTWPILSWGASKVFLFSPLSKVILDKIFFKQFLASHVTNTFFCFFFTIFMIIPSFGLWQAFQLLCPCMSLSDFIQSAGLS